LKKGICETWTWDIVPDVIPDVYKDAMQVEWMQDVDDLGHAVERRRHELPNGHELQNFSSRFQLNWTLGSP
jgi:hypothetical protein